MAIVAFGVNFHEADICYFLLLEYLINCSHLHAFNPEIVVLAEAVATLMQRR